MPFTDIEFPSLPFILPTLLLGSILLFLTIPRFPDARLTLSRISVSVQSQKLSDLNMRTCGWWRPPAAATCSASGDFSPKTWMCWTLFEGDMGAEPVDEFKRRGGHKSDLMNYIQKKKLGCAHDR